MNKHGAHTPTNLAGDRKKKKIFNDQNNEEKKKVKYVLNGFFSHVMKERKQ